jgi:hypothetical protein
MNLVAPPSPNTLSWEHSLQSLTHMGCGVVAAVSVSRTHPLDESFLPLVTCYKNLCELFSMMIGKL